MTLFALETDPLTFAYPGGPTLLNGMPFRAAAGQLTVLIGANGAGKSTLMRILAGLLRAGRAGVRLRGEVSGDPADGAGRRAEGVELSRLSARERARWTAFLPQTVVPPEDVRVEEVVALGRHPHERWWSLPGPADAERLRVALSAVGAAGLLGRMFAELSGGEQQAVLLASVLVQATPVLLLDEPGKALDIHHQAVLFARLRSMAAEGRTVVAITHDLNIAARYADRLALLHGGHIVADGAPREVLTAQRLQATYGPDVTVVPDPRDGLPIVLPAADLGRPMNRVVLEGAARAGEPRGDAAEAAHGA
ncbi:MAG: ABC transporter ATP-binding protein [Planctomycetota bacterium]